MNSNFFNDHSNFQLVKSCEELGTVAPNESQIKDLANLSEDRARQIVPFEQAEILEVLPLKITNHGFDKELLVATKKGVQQHVVQVLQFCTNCQIKIYECDAEIIKPALFKAYKQNSDLLLYSASKLKNVAVTKSLTKERYEFNKQAFGDVAKFIEALLNFAIASEVSDVHITPLLNGSSIRVRKNGEILEHESVVGNSTAHQQIVNRIKVLSGIPVTKLYEPCDGTFEAGSSSHSAEVRVSIMPSIHGENIVLRIHSASSIKFLDQLGLTSMHLASLNNVIHKPEGIIIFSGPTGSGKTTALYALIQELLKKKLIISTIEDPVEQKIPGVVQTAVQPEHGLTYAKCLKAVLRQDPDILVVGELRDEESAKLIIQAGVTGHLVLTSVHASNILAVFKRFQNFGVSTHDLVASVRHINSFKLLPKLCQHCSVIDLASSKLAGFEVRKSVGCAECDYSLYVGSQVIAEYLVLKDNTQHRAKSLFLEPSDLQDLGEFVCFREAFLRALKSGLLDWKTASPYL